MKQYAKHKFLFGVKLLQFYKRLNFDLKKNKLGPYFTDLAQNFKTSKNINMELDLDVTFFNRVYHTYIVYLDPRNNL